jgi:hypothetical protein
MIEHARCEAERVNRAHRAREVDERMDVLVRQKNEIVAEMVLLVHEIERDRLFRALGATSVTAYMKKRAAWDASKTEKIAALARNIEELPRLREALVRGALGWTTAYLASVVATPETDADWTEKALKLTQNQFEAETARAKGRPVVQRVTLNVSPAQLAAVDLAVTAVRSEDPSKKLAFGEAVAEACKRAIEGGGAGGANTQLVIHICADCHRATREGKNGPVEISPSELAALACDAEVVDIRTKKARLSRTIPPRIKRFVRARDHGRCRVPECQNRAHVNFHHEGGWLNVGHDPLSVYLICVGHHQAIHDGDLIVRKLAPGRFEFFRLDRGSIGQIDLNEPMENPGAFRAEGSRAEIFRAEGSAGESARAENPGTDTFRTEGPAGEGPPQEGDRAATFRAEGPAERVREVDDGTAKTLRVEGAVSESVRAEDLGAETFRAEGFGRTAPEEEDGADTFRTEGPALGEVAREAAIAVAFLRKLEFRATEARELVRRGIRSTPRKHWTAHELVRAALQLVE